jgi:hypothetical protein
MRRWMPALVLKLALLGLAAVAASQSAFAQTQDEPVRPRPYRRPPLRLEVVPPSQLYRQCTDWYVIEPRAAGPTIVPQMRCRWALRR